MPVQALTFISVFLCAGFPLVTCAVLPYLVHNYENPCQMCRDAADNVAQVS